MDKTQQLIEEQVRKEMEDMWLWVGENKANADGFEVDYMKEFERTLRQALTSLAERVREELMREVNQETDVVQFRANELHVFARNVIDTVIITQNGKRYEISLQSFSPTSKDQ